MSSKIKYNLLPCPFCSSTNVSIDIRYVYDDNGPDYNYPYVNCNNCYAKGQESDGFDHIDLRKGRPIIEECRKQAENYWNTRSFVGVKPFVVAMDNVHAEIASAALSILEGKTGVEDTIWYDKSRTMLDHLLIILGNGYLHSDDPDILANELRKIMDTGTIR